MISFDTETSQDTENKIVYLDLCVFYNGSEYFTFDKKDYVNQIELKKAVIEFIYDSSDNLFVAHNLEYDLNSIFYPYYLKNLELFYNNNLIYGKLKSTRKKFIDSFNFSFVSLKTLGKQIGLEKMEVEGQFYNVEYCKRDCEIVWLYMQRFKINLENEFNLKIKNTLAGTSQNIFLKRFDNYKSGGKNTDPELLNYYYGGRTECFKLGEIRKPVYCLDINSSYPTSMMNTSLPISDFYITESAPIEYNWLAEVEIEINDCFIPVLPYRTDKLLFPTGKFKTFINSIEYQKAKDLNQIKEIKFIKVYNFEDSGFIFNSFVDYFYTKRQTAKDENDDFLSSYYKLILNSTYGRFALHGGMKVLKEYDYSNGYYELLNNEELIYKDVEMSGGNSINYSIPIFITANSRILLYNLFEKVLSIKGDILYTDTDSCYFTLSNNIEKDLKLIEKAFPINNNLGAYSLETFKAMDIYNVKGYILHDFDSNVKSVCKGIPKDKRFEFLTTGKTNYNKPLKLRSALRGVDNIPANFWYDLFVRRQGEYTKRKKIPVKVTGKKEVYYNTMPVNLG